MRQKNDRKLAEASSHLAKGTLTDEMNAMFESRTITKLMQMKCYPPPETLHLFYTNNDKNNFNTMQLAKMNTESYLIEALDVCIGNPPEKKGRVYYLQLKIIQLIKLKIWHTKYMLK